MECRECHAVLPDEARFCPACGARTEPAPGAAPGDPLRDALEKAIGFQYRIERLLGRGGMGAVYLAHELALDRRVAIKVLLPEQAGTQELRARFQREARTAARLTHPNIVPLHTFGEVSGLMYFVMGYVDGESLAALLRQRGPFGSEAARALLGSLCDALDYAHRQGVVHRDIKPDNILIDAGSGSPLLLDFGVAKAGLREAHLTTDGQVMGTPHYMSPEQALGKADVGPPSDLYSLGVVAYETLSGKLPFAGSTAIEALTQRLSIEPPPLTTTAPLVPADLAQAVDRCLQKDPARRWPDALSLREALLPSEEEPEDTFQERLLRVCSSIILLSLVAAGLAGLMVFLEPGLLPSPRSKRLLLSVPLTTGVVMIIGSMVATIRIRRQGTMLRSIARRAFLQPTWWHGWYPRRLRRRGDVWDRLPREIRLFRAYRSTCLLFVLVVFLPVQFLAAIDPDLSTLGLSLLVFALAMIAGMFRIRRRAAARIESALGTTGAEASRLLNTPTWRTSAWRRPSVAPLLASPR